MKPGNGLEKIFGREGGYDSSHFSCMKLIEFITQEGLNDWEDWEYLHKKAELGECRYKDKCPLYEKTANKFNLNIEAR